MQDTLTFTYSKGYFDLGNVIDVPEGALISPSRNVLFDMNGRLTSFRGFTGVYSEGDGPQIGGNKTFVVDKDTVAFYGKLDGSTLTPGLGNVTTAVGRSLWFVSNSGSSMRVFDIKQGEFIGIGGEYHLEVLDLDESTVDLTQYNVSANSSSISSGGSYFELSTGTHSLELNTPVRIRRKAQLPAGLTEGTVYYISRMHDQGAEVDKYVNDLVEFKLMEYHEERFCILPSKLLFSEDRQTISIGTALDEDTPGPVWEDGDEVYVLSNETGKDLLARYLDASSNLKDLRPYTKYYVVNLDSEEDEETGTVSWSMQLAETPGGTAITFIPNSEYSTSGSPTEQSLVTTSVKIIGGKPVDLTSDGTEESLAKSTSGPTEFKFTGEDSTDILTSAITLTLESGQGVTVSPTGTMPAPLKENEIYYVRLVDEPYEDTRFRVAENTLETTGPIQLQNSGSGGFVVDVNPYLTVTFTSEEPAITSRVFKVPVNEGDNENLICEAIRNTLRGDSEIAANFFVNSVGSEVRIQDRVIRENNLSVVLSAGSGVDSETSVETQAGGPVLEYEFNNSIPHYSKYENGAWTNPVPVGLPELDEIDKPILSVSTASERGRGFEGLITGSRTARVARKRLGAVSIASPPSNLVLGADTGSSLFVNIPVPSPDDSPREDNTWLLYFTFGGLGSTATHTLFPLEIPEAELDGSAEPELRQSGNAKYKVVKQSLVSKDDRVVEVEFLDNDLLPLDPFEDYYPAESSRFIVKMANSMCLIGTGDDGTGVDVSFPNNYEAFTPEWRDWLSEPPVSVATEAELGYFWICTANNVYVAQWTGVTEESAPVLIEKRSTKIGAIGENASVCVGGMLYLLSPGKTPVRMSPDGQADIFYGARVQEFFRSTIAGQPAFDDTTTMAWDSVNNSIVFTCRDVSIAFQIDTQLWSAPIYSNFDALHSFEINGLTYQTAKTNVGTEGEPDWKLATYTWNSGLEYDWNVTSSFYMGRYGRSLKDLTKVEIMYTTPYLKPMPADPTEQEESDVNASNSLVLRAYKNFRNESPETLVTIPLARVNSTLSVRKYIERLDYDCVSLRIDGKLGGQTIHMANCEVDVHRIERTSL